MIMNASTKLPKVFVFIIPQVIPTRNTLERVPLGSSNGMQPKRGLGVRINVLIIPYASISSCNVNN